MGRGETSGFVRAIAEAHGVSQRTVWRWFAAMRAGGNRSLDPLKLSRFCDQCGEPLPKTATMRRRFCDPGCRVAHHRHRQASGVN